MSRLRRIVLYTATLSVIAMVNAPRGYSAVGNQVDSTLSQYERAGFSGAVLLEIDGTTVIRKGYGTSCDGRKITPDMAFDLGSITKIYTAAVALKMVQSGNLNLNDTIDKYIDGLKGDLKNITILHLLTHTSGLADSFGADEVYVSAEEFIDLVRHSRLHFPPGDDKLYSNAGYSVLGYIVQQVSGKRYEENLVKNLFEPAQLRNTGYLIPEWQDSLIACGELDGKPWGAVLDYFERNEPSWFLVANGGLLSTLDETHRFFELLIGGRVLDESRTDLIVAHMTHRTKTGGDRLFSVSGANRIFSSLYMNWLDKGVVLILFTNNSEWPKERVYPALLPIIDQSMMTSPEADQTGRWTWENFRSTE